MPYGGIRLHRSNHMEVLVRHLGQQLRHAPLAPMETECIVVQGAAMQRWLSIELSEQLGVLGNVRFPFPSHVLSQVMTSLDPSVGAESFRGLGPIDKDAMVWGIAEILDENIENVAFAEVRAYLSRSDVSKEYDEKKRFQLAEKISRVFDQYTMYRPELLRGWESDSREYSQEEGWQCLIWRQLHKKFSPNRRTNNVDTFWEKISAGNGQLENIPRRLFFFGISALPPLYMKMVAALASRVEVHLYVLSPSREYWADIRKQKASSEHSVYMDEGNPLLSSLGRLAGDFQQVLEDAAEYNESGEDLYVDPSIQRNSILATLQADILHLVHRGSKTGDVGPLPILDGDRSISVHSCHSQMRELEVLHDQLVSHLEGNVGLDARDIVVMAPDIESYAPMIEAVFGSSNADRPRIAYRISDRSDQCIVSVLIAYSQILKTMVGRMSAPAIMDLLELEVVRDRFAILEDDLPVIRKWVLESGIRWGRDSAHRVSVGQPGFSENTWRFGLDRLLLGYAIECEGVASYGGILGYDDMEGTQVDLLGRFLSFCDTLFSAADLVSRSVTMNDWSIWLLDVLATMIVATESNAGEHQIVRDVVTSLLDETTRAEFCGVVPYDTIRSILESKWQIPGTARGFLAGGVTFCQLTPMRSIPFQVVCILGMSDGVFPRNAPSVGFDLVSGNPRLGDRTIRDDDRYLFLEAILAARDALLITYVGRSVKNNAEISPSVLVGELMDVLDDSFSSERGSVRNHLLTNHPLQPFSPKYFDTSTESGLFSFSEAHCSGAKSLAELEKSPSAPFLSAPLVREVALQKRIRLSDLISFFQKPTQFFLERGLGLYLAESEASLPGREPIELEGLETWKIADDVLREVLNPDAPESLCAADFYEPMRRSGRIPLGTVGECWYEELEVAIGELRGQSELFMAGEKCDNIAVVDRIADIEIEGEINQIWPTARVRIGFSRLGKRSEIGTWIQHLFLCMTAPDNYPKETIMIGRGKSGPDIEVVRFRAVENPRPLLNTLVELYRIGQFVPLPFFPESSRRFAAGIKKKTKEGVPPEIGSPEFDRALEVARGVFEGGPRQPGEIEDPYVTHVFGGTSCLEPGYLPYEDMPSGYQNFTDLSLGILGPLLEHRGGVDR